jgi:hypothetical protein
VTKGAGEKEERPGLVPRWACACAGVHIGTRASDPRGLVRERERERDHGAASRSQAARHGIQRRQGSIKPASECASMKAAAPARNLIPAWHEGRHHQRRAFRLGSMAVASTGGKKRVSSPLWPLAEVQASVQRGGAACRRGGRRSRRWRGGGEEEEVGDVVVPGGSGSSLRRLRSSRRTALPRAAPFLLLPSFSPFSSGSTAWLVRGVAPWGG